MHLIPDVRRVLTRAYSLRLMELAALAEIRTENNRRLAVAAEATKVS